MTTSTVKPGFDLPGAPPLPAELAERLARALEAQPDGYVARTHHKEGDGKPRFTNRLILETSPYLLQHAHNPVSWYAWGDEAFRAAKSLNRPILLSVGYSTCHWCHVMEAESFEDLEIAEYINTHYVAIKVDREERPDVDSVYMQAVMLLNRGNGGWPMTVVMTPEGRPFFGGTYFPPRDGARGSRVGFLTVLKKLQEIWTNEPQKVFDGAQQLTTMLQMQSQRIEPQGMPKATALHDAAARLVASFDPRWGGFDSAPKFPRPSTYDLLLRYHRRTGDAAALRVVTDSLTAMSDGGIYDHLAGGFHRYSTDERWLVPHFEKMLYDNAQLVVTLVEAHQVTGDDAFAITARETLDYVRREMTSPEGGFYSATDADSEGEEGKFFVWTPEEIEAVVGKERARVVAAWYGVTKYGNFEHKNILNRSRSAAEVARELGITVEQLERELEEAKQQLYDAREKRPHPLRDDKVLTEWNGQMISAFAKGARVLGEEVYAATATKAAAFVLENMRTDQGRLLRAWRSGRARHTAMLEDYAFFIAGLLDLFEATHQQRWLEEAIALETLLERHHLDPRVGGFFSTPEDGEKLLVREKPTYDGAQPSGNSIAALNLLRLAELTSSDAYRERAEKLLTTLAATLENGAPEAPKLATALDFYLDKPKEVVIVTSSSDDGAALRKLLARTFLPNSVSIVVAEPAVERLQKLIPLVENKRAIGGKATAYVCTDRVCKAPTSSPEIFAKQLAEVEMLPLHKKLTLPRASLRRSGED